MISYKIAFLNPFQPPFVKGRANHAHWKKPACGQAEGDQGGFSWFIGDQPAINNF